MNRCCLWMLVSLSILGRGVVSAEPRIPILYSTDLLHPHDDPDDHYDLATLFALPEFDIRGVVLDLGERQAKRSGRPPVEQMMQITGRRVPTAVGLNRPLKDRTDKALDAPREFQAGVEMILSVLRDAPGPITLFSTGSCRDVAAAFNREPELLKRKVKAYYANVGRGPNERQDEWNVTLDGAAYLRLFESGLPLYWCPCFGKDGYETHFVVDQATVVGVCTPAVQNFFVYCLRRSSDDPLAFLKSGPHPAPTGPRNMWCTAPLFHAAGRTIYERGPDDFVALSPAAADKAGFAAKAVTAFRFVPIVAHVASEPSSPAAVAVPEPAPDKLAAVYAGCSQDRVGTQKPEPDGRQDCCVRVAGVGPDLAIKNIVLTGPKEARWESVETGRWWRLAYERSGRQLDCYFQFWAAGEHQLDVIADSGVVQSVKFAVPEAPAPGFRVEFPRDNRSTSITVFQTADPRYRSILASSLRNVLRELGR